MGEPASTISSLAFVVAAAAVVVGRRGAQPTRSWFAALVAATGVGSVIDHGWNAPGGDLLHDLPLVALVALLAVDAARDLADRHLADAWWIAPTLGLVPVIVAAPRIGDGLQLLVAVIAIALSVRRAWVRPAPRASIVTALTVLAAAAVIGTLSRQGWPLCESGLLIQGHAVWHVLAAGALWFYAPALTPAPRAEPDRARDRALR